MQLNDGPRLHDDLQHHARTRRYPPGDGKLDVTGLVRTHTGIGYTGPYSVEVNYPGPPGNQAALAVLHAAIPNTAMTVRGPDGVLPALRL